MRHPRPWSTVSLLACGIGILLCLKFRSDTTEFVGGLLAALGVLAAAWFASAWNLLGRSE